MIAKLKGLVDTKDASSLIVDVGGVGYLVQASGRTLDRMPAHGDAVSLHIETQVREDAITLFGFLDLAERDMFRLLTSVQGVGAKVGLAILSVLEPQKLQNAIAAQDKGAVAQANGVGPKLAARIVNELKDKVAGFVLETATSGQISASKGAAPAIGAGTTVSDTVAGLVALGYKPVDAHQAVARAMEELGEDASVQQLIPRSLKELGRL